MPRKQLIIVGIAVALLLAAGSTALILRPWEGLGSSGSQASSVTAAAGDTTVMLTWQTLSGANGYFIYRDAAKDPLNPTPIKETKYEDIGLSNGRTYRYEVAPVDATGTPGKRTSQVQVVPRSK